MVKSQIERLKKDLRNLEDAAQRMIDQDRGDCLKGILLKKQYLKDHIEQLLNCA